MMVTDNCGLYVHIPFCIKKCDYCDFCSKRGDIREMEAYTASLISEILSYRRGENKISLDTVYFGGGTPSVLPIEFIEQIMEAINEAFEILPSAEITIEVNPKTTSLTGLKKYKSLGFNRLSIGMQSMHDDELEALGRAHNYDDFCHCFTSARHAGFDNINIDIMYGIPKQGKLSFAITVKCLTEVLCPEHISCYGLMIEEGTPFYKKRNKLALPDEDTEADMYYSAHEEFTAKGYLHYEISNYAKPGYESRHNMRYWKMRPYIGVGLAAHSFFSGKRYANTEDMNEYLGGKRESYSYITEPAEGADCSEYIMLALRTSDGIIFKDFEARYGRPFNEGLEKNIEELTQRGFAIIDSEHFALTPRGFYVSNCIITEILNAIDN